MDFLETTPKHAIITEIENFQLFRQEGQHELYNFLMHLFNLDDVRFQYTDHDQLLDFLKADSISSVMENPSRNNEVCLVSQVVVDGELIANFPYILVGRDVKKYMAAKRLYKRVAEAISDQLTICYLQRFRNTRWLFGEKFADLFVSNCISSNQYNGDSFSELIETMERMAVSTFEGDSFTTGVIVSFNINKYKNKVLDLSLPREIRQLSKREFFLVDGISTFYIASSDMLVRKVFISEKVKTQYYFNEYYQNYYLFNQIYEPDFIVRTVGHNEVSVCDAFGKEFVKSENVWHYRYKAQFTEFLGEELGISDELCKAILYYVLYCSRNHISSIIWIPNDDSIDELITDNRVKLWNQKINMLNPLHEPLMKKILASDGAIVVEKNGDIMYECVFAKMKHNDTVNTAEARNNTLKGSGESAAKILAQNGVSIKISQDGAIKIFYGEKKWCY